MAWVETSMIRPAGYADPDAQRLIDAVQQEYVRIYGGPDETPVRPDEFAPPSGAFFVAYDGDDPVAMGGWRLTETHLGGPAAELKRMYVVDAARGRGHARRVLAHLETTAAAAGAEWLILETGTGQPAAIALYRSAGYTDIPAFGHYADSASSVHLAKQLTDCSG